MGAGLLGVGSAGIVAGHIAPSVSRSSFKVAASFGVVTGTRDARVAQVALKIYF